MKDLVERNSSQIDPNDSYQKSLKFNTQPSTLQSITITMNREKSLISTDSIQEALNDFLMYLNKNSENKLKALKEFEDYYFKERPVLSSS
mmetsp:Transcript_34452/g.33653  ORF Transcript_34452/g.33653 Transcript_34452/m.33653 type:complete len:90 (-) Transcript_34452:1606-1875(-)